MKDLLTELPALVKQWRGKPLYLFLDFDGTLVPIAKRPHEVKIDPALKILLKTIAQQPQRTVGIISGRSLQDIKKQVGVPELYYAGNHGIEIAKGKLFYCYPPARAYRKIMNHLATWLAPLTKTPGILLENKTLSLSLHYRLVTQLMRQKTKKTAIQLIKANQAQLPLPIKWRQGKQCLEIIADLPWHKGNAILWLQQHIKKRPAATLYLGDDQTDEDAFQTLNHLTPPGITVRVGKKRKTHARYFLKNVNAVKICLAYLGGMAP